MPPLILYIATSLDGFIAGKKGDISWLVDPYSSVDYGYNQFIKGIGAVIMGSKTFDLTREFDPWPYKGIPSIIASRKALKLPEGEDIVVMDGSPGALLEEARKRAQDKAVWLIGGGELATSFFKEALIDELMIFPIPIILGEGIPLFRAGIPQILLKLREVKTYGKGLVLLHYDVQR